MQTILGPSGAAFTLKALVMDVTFNHEASSLDDVSTPSQDQQQTLTEFIDQNPSYTVDRASWDSSRSTAHRAETDIDKFFARPVKIYDFSWSTNTLPDIKINPWDIWLSNPRVSNRLTCYRNFQGELHLKIVVNGNQFYFGRMLVSYLPYNDSTYVSQDPAVTGDLMAASQRSHIWVDPSTSQGGELVLPFFYPDDSVLLTNSDPMGGLGQLWIAGVVPLKHNNNLTRAVDVAIFAWCENVMLSGPTSIDVGGLSPQSGEYGEGPISKPASVLANLAGKLKDTPVIGKYAMATQMAASGVSKIAALFGYSRPRLLKPDEPVKVWQTGNLSNVDEPVSTQTLALTSKQEVTIDPTTTGINPCDELSFACMAAIPSYICKFNWDINNGQDTVLFSTDVSPTIKTVYSSLGSADAVSIPPVTMVAMPFDFWRGSMTYRFQIVASGYHKGRLLAIWDARAGNVNPEMNTVYSKIIDIAEERDFEIDVGWGSHLPYLSVPRITGTPTNTYKLDGTIMTGPTASTNGTLTLYVLNQWVTSGENTDPIEILVHAYSKDLEVFAPATERFRYLTYVPQLPAGRALRTTPENVFKHESGVIQSDENEGMANHPLEADNTSPVGGTGSTPTLTSICAGEKITSFRQCLKRYALRRAVYFTVSSPVNHSNVIVEDTPFPNNHEEYQPQTLLNLLAGAFCGYRGSFKVKALPGSMMRRMLEADTSHDVISNMRLSRATNVSNGGSVTATFHPNTQFSIDDWAKLYDEAWSGEQMTVEESGFIHDVEIPYYVNKRFLVNNSFDTTSQTMGYVWSVLLPPDAETTAVIKFYTAVGEDFNFFNFKGIPPLWDTGI